MSTALPRPLRVLVKGASTVHTVSWMGKERGDFAYPRATEVALYAAGVPAEVRCTAVSSQRTKTGLKTWETDGAPWSPDVVVLNYGHFETIHLFLPQRLERHVHSMATRPGRFRANYRTALRKLWMVLARLQAQLDSRVDSTMFKHRPRRVADRLVRFVERTQLSGSPLVVIVELTPPGERFWKWFPGMSERTGVMNEALADVVRRVDLPHVRYFPTNTILAPLMADGEVNPDGGHYTPEAHRMIGEHLAGMIAGWAHQEGLVATTDASAADRSLGALPE
jgi:hypothetical protein